MVLIDVWLFGGGAINTIEKIQQINRSGPWTTKSGGRLEVLCRLGFSESLEFLNYFKDSDIRGLRIYIVSFLPKKAVGGKEFHKIRSEILIVVNGKILLICEDVKGGRMEYVLTPETGGIMVPPYILHTYIVQEEGSSILVLANTDFDPEDPLTHDSYPEREFHL